MQKTNLILKNNDRECVMAVFDDTHYIIKLIGKTLLDSSITFKPAREDINIKVSVYGVLTENSQVKLAVVLDHDKSIKKFNYALEATVMVSGRSKAAILPILKVKSTRAVANHKVVIGSIDSSTRQFFSSKGIDSRGVIKLYKEKYTRM